MDSSDPRPPEAAEQRLRHRDSPCRLVVLGLVGDIAGGKSTVARRLSVRGAEWIDADQLAHRCLQLTSVREALVTRFSSDILDESGHIDRSKLAAAVFAGDDFRELEFLESVLHPVAFQLAIKRLENAFRQQKSVVVLDAPLLLEAGWGHLCDAIWCVLAPEPVRLARVASRGWDREELHARQRRQWDSREKSRLSTHLLVNGGDRSSLLHQVDELWDFLHSSAPKKDKIDIT